MLMDYHLIFIVLSIILLILTVFCLFLMDTSVGSIDAALIFSGVNWLFCIINYMGFMGVNIIGYLSTGEIELNPVADMAYLFSFFYLLHFLNAAFIIFCWRKRIQMIAKEMYQKKNTYD